MQPDSRLGTEGLALTVHAMPQARLEGTPADAVQRRRGRWKMLAVLAASAAPVLASYFLYFVVRPDAKTTNYAAFIVPTRAWPAAMPLVDADGRAVDPASWRRRWTLVVFGTASCDAACERRLFAQRQLREMLGRERDRLDKVFVVLDDAPLRPELATALARAPATRVLRAPAPSEAIHAWLGAASAADLEGRLYVVDPMGEWMMRTPVELEPAKFKRDLERLLRASSSWQRAPGD